MPRPGPPRPTRRRGYGATTRPGALFAPSAVWQLAQAPSDWAADIASVRPSKVSSTVYGVAMSAWV